MILRFHGVRGSIPTSDQRTWRYGGNTSCIEVETPAGHRIILDGGTGLRSLYRSSGWVGSPDPVRAFWLLTHYHWDHIQGLPFFPPLYDGRNHFEFFGLRPEGGEGIESALQGQMFRPYFPTELSALAAARSFTVVEEGHRWQLGDATIEADRLNHPQGSLGYRIETEHGVATYATDTEPGDARGDAAVRHLARHTDVLIYDAHFSPELLVKRRGWGHSSWEHAVSVAQDADARCLVLFHHDPDSDDTTVDHFLQSARERWPNTWAAAEGLQVTCRTPVIEMEMGGPRAGPRLVTRLPVRLRGRRADGSEMELAGVITNLTLRGGYLVAPESPGLSSEIEIKLDDPPEGGTTITGEVVRAAVDEETGQQGIGVVFHPEDRPPPGAPESKRPAKGRRKPR